MSRQSVSSSVVEPGAPPAANPGNLHSGGPSATQHHAQPTVASGRAGSGQVLCLPMASTSMLDRYVYETRRGEVPVTERLWQKGNLKY
ncbi:hypothetical protein TOPH_07020 [Tolypocladium ophioglossoides CBS 100239]|uniref:Uncharacterized protein n=1 Tax=Tolypocladium ophioglossoides (strain CBS 100239) TaxID=1163406 RepID=A0A0L0N2X9_TOLOC|nr:hypothetical protein TOPH_07020 [Tolypocladium ophioglossoides CBS 100239]